MSDQVTPKEECLYCHGLADFFGPGPGCGETHAPETARPDEVRRADPLSFAQGNLYFEFSSSHPHV